MFLQDVGGRGHLLFRAKWCNDFDPDTMVRCKHLMKRARSRFSITSACMSLLDMGQDLLLLDTDVSTHGADEAVFDREPGDLIEGLFWKSERLARERQMMLLDKVIHVRRRQCVHPMDLL